MKTVLFINSLRAGGAERIMARIADHLTRLGDETLLVTHYPLSSDAYPTCARRTSLSVSQPSDSLWRTLSNNALRLVRFIRLLRQERPDCIVAFLPTPTITALLAGKLLRIPVIVGERSNPAITWSAPLQKALQRIFYPQAYAIAVQTRSTADWYQNTLKIDNTPVIPNGVRLPLPRNEPSVSVTSTLRADDHLVLSVGRLDTGKNVGAVLRAFAQIDQTSGWKLVHIGSGPLAEEIDRLARTLQIEHRFHHFEQVGNMQDWYERADVFATASLFEGFPNVLLEAMACECACIAYDCPTGPAELIDHEINGLLVPLGDERTFAVELARLCQSAQLRGSLATMARNVTQSHADQTMLDAWAKLIHQAAQH